MIEVNSPYERWGLREEYVEWSMPKRVFVENGNWIDFFLVKYKERSYEKADYHCFIYECEADGTMINRYWRGFKNDYYKGVIYGDFVDKFINDVDYRDRFNTKHGEYQKGKQTVNEVIDGINVPIDAEIHELIKELRDAGYDSRGSCRGTAFAWCDHPRVDDAHLDVAYVDFAVAPTELIEKLKNNKYILASDGCIRISSSARDYNTMFPEIMMSAIAALKRETPSIT
jgi:hypothetical protein